MSDVIEAEVVEATEIVPSAGPVGLFRTTDPAEVLAAAKRTADALAPVIRGAGLVVSVNGKDYLTVEAWQTLGQQVGVTGVIVSTRRLTDPNGWEARCEARTLDGRTIGAADSMCLKEEARWKDSEDFEIRSMAQTRAMSRALASVLRFIPTLVGMGGTPAEEMGNVKSGGKKREPSEKQLAFLERKLKEAGLTAERAEGVRVFVKSTMDIGQASEAIDSIGKDGGAEKLWAAAMEWQVQDATPPTSGESEGHDESIPF